ncbi:hypothetical protein P5673_025351 [Acropora cervicornis]|uniref:VWFC domain-containing protein n=1 Tax=Acropora cervicornis TaxID=6130 RepID=A0AAD9Q2J4_ACRCE|nr:hypothetical protein P5673_025351 [Acropora cervicornis]
MRLLLLSVLFLAFFQVSPSAIPEKIPSLFLQERPEDNQCFYYGKVYKPGVKFADESCKAWCECNGASGHVVCVSLCPPLLPVPCSPGETAVTMKVKSVDPTGRCMCKHLKQCGKDKLNKWFFNGDCSGRCKCTVGGISCVSLCPPIAVRCSPGMEKITFRLPMDEDATCTCPREKCVERKIESGKSFIRPWHTAAILDLKRGWTGINNVL